MITSSTMNPETSASALQPREKHIQALWIPVVAYALYIPLSLAHLIPTLVDVNVSVFLPWVFAMAHGAARYKVRGILAFLIICLVISNIFENLSILTGFPFGHYHYTEVLGPKLFLVPLLIGPAYFGTGYLSWMLASILIGEVKRGADKLTVFAVPFVGSFIMVFWDLCFDPSSSTKDKEWIWHHGGGYFGVPLTNYLGWFFTVYCFLQVFAFCLRKYDISDEQTIPLPKAYWWQAVWFYALLAVGYPLEYFTGQNGTMTDATGKVWSVHDFHETAAIVSIYTMFFAVSLAAIKLTQTKLLKISSKQDSPSTKEE